MEEKSVTKTVVCGLQTSNRKNEKLRSVVDDWQKVASHLADVAVGYKQYQLEGRSSALYRASKDVEDVNIHSKGKLAAAGKVSDAFVSWMKQPQNNQKPQSEFGDGDYCRFTNQEIELVKNDGSYAVKISMIPYKPEWFNLNYGQHQAEVLEECLEGESKLGAFEIHYNNGNPQIHIAVTRYIDVLEPDEVETYVGIDLGENVLYALGTGSDERKAHLKDGAEFRHHREKLSQRKDQEQAKGNLKKVKEISGERLKYTDWVTHTASRSIVDEAKEYDKPCIVLEDLTGYRESKGEYAIHDWPYAEIQQKIMYKATEEGIPVMEVDPAYTSQTCNRCKTRGNRNGSEFYCSECDYEVHADVNAAFNIADRGDEERNS